MKPRLKSSRAVRDLIMAHEPFHETATRRGRRFVVGFGHTAGAREGVQVTRQDAELLLFYDVLKAEEAVNAAVGEGIAPGVRDALVSFATSIGPAAFKVSDVARLARSGRHREALTALETWVRAEQDGRLVVSEELTRRRSAEKDMYQTGLDAASENAQSLQTATPPVSAPEHGDDPHQEDAPRIGPLVEVDIEFETPVEDVQPQAAVSHAPAEPMAPVAVNVDDFARAEIESAARRPAPEAAPPSVMPEPEDEARPSQMAMETTSEDTSRSEEASTQTAETPVEAEPIEAPAVSSIDRDAQAELVKSVVDRVSAQMKDRPQVEVAPHVEKPPQPSDIHESVAEAAVDQAEEDESKPQLGYSYLTPEEADANLKTETQENRAALQSKDQVVEKTAASASSKALETRSDQVAYRTSEPVRVAIDTTAEPTPASELPVQPKPSIDEVKPSSLAPNAGIDTKAPARSEGLSGEAAGAGPYEDTAIQPQGEDDELSPHHVAGREAEFLTSYEPPMEEKGDWGRWFYIGPLFIGMGLSGVGVWDFLNPADPLSQAQGIPNWLITIAMGIVVSLTSLWFFFSGNQRAKDKAGPRVHKDIPGVSGEA